MILFLCFLFAYFLGSIPFGVLVGKWKGVNLREEGSGNIGAANAFRALGALPGLLVLLGDTAKGFFPLVVMKQILPKASSLEYVGVGLFAILGHTYSCFLKFRGGKGIAAILGVFLFLNWKATLAAFSFWVLLVAITKISSLGSLVATFLLPVFLYCFREATIYIVFATGAFLLALYKHRTNLRKLFSGQESKLM